ncbi:MAG: hypothetical protein AB7T14_10105, partial [Candidatus Methylacidiphilaceae bacterium]
DPSGLTGKGVATSEKTPFESMLAKVDQLDFSTAPNKAVFYSGPGQGAQIIIYAEHIGATTIEMRPGGR